MAKRVMNEIKRAECIRLLTHTNLSATEVSKKTGISKATIYYHCGSKRVLQAALKPMASKIAKKAGKVKRAA